MYTERVYILHLDGTLNDWITSEWDKEKNESNKVKILTENCATGKRSKLKKLTMNIISMLKIDRKKQREKELRKKSESFDFIAKDEEAKFHINMQTMPSLP